MTDKDMISARLREHWHKIDSDENQQLSDDLYDAADLIEDLQKKLNELIKETRRHCNDLSYEIDKAEEKP